LRRSGWKWKRRSTNSVMRRITPSKTLRVNRYSLIVKRAMVIQEFTNNV
jgi:hypothetical protein